MNRDANALERTFDSEEARGKWPPAMIAKAQHAFARRAGLDRHAPNARLGLLAWGRRYLKAHFSRPASAMHRWLAKQLGATRHARGQKVNCLGPRGSAKSTIATLAFPLRAALEGRERYIWIVSDTKHQARAHLDNLRAELDDNATLRQAYPDAFGRALRSRAGQIVLANGATLEAFGTGQRLRGRRRGAVRPTLIICDRIGSRVERVAFSWER